MITEAVTIGSIVKAVGLKGEVKLLPGSDFWPGALHAAGLDLVSSDGSRRNVRVEKMRVKGRTFILKLSGVEGIDEAESVVGSDVVVSLEGLDSEQMPEAPLPCQLMGLEARLQNGEVVGRVVDLLLGPDQQCLIVERASERFLVPNVPDVVVRIDLPGGFIVLDPPEGLLDLRW
jgi:16S rRNA processing protein RimM